MISRCFRISALIVFIAGCAANAPSKSLASPTMPPTVRTTGYAPAPTQPPSSIFGQPIAARYRKLASRAGNCEEAQAKSIIGIIEGILYIRCGGGTIAALDSRRRIMATRSLPMNGINRIERAGSDAVVIAGWSDGASLINQLAILRARTLKPITMHVITDSSFLGVIANRAYIDDWCCNGRPDVYRPATIYSISLKSGAESKPVDLSPDPQMHRKLQPLGQGERNYLIGTQFYVVVGPVTYRYDVLNLSKPPERLITR